MTMHDAWRDIAHAMVEYVRATMGETWQCYRCGTQHPMSVEHCPCETEDLVGDRYVTREMALDAGDPSLEGEIW